MNGISTDNSRRFDSVIRPHFDALYRAAMRLTRRREDAEDLVQDVLLRAFPALGQLETLDSPRGWLLRVQYRIFVDGYRRRHRSPVVALPEGADSDGADDQISRLLFRHTHSPLQSLGPRAFSLYDLLRHAPRQTDRSGP